MLLDLGLYPLSPEGLHGVRNCLEELSFQLGILIMPKFPEVCSIVHLFARYSLEKFGYSSQKDKTL